MKTFCSVGRDFLEWTNSPKEKEKKKTPIKLLFSKSYLFKEVPAEVTKPKLYTTLVGTLGP